MDNKENTWGILIVLFLLFIVFGGGFGIGNRGVVASELGGNCGGCGRVSNCEVERQEIIDTYNTQLNTINQSILTRSNADANAQRLFDQSRSQYDAQQGEKIFDLKMENQGLKGMLYSNEKFGKIENQLEALACQLPKRPPYWAQGFVPDGERVPRNGGCGCGVA